MSTIVRNEADLDTLLDENLVTEDYALEILGLKNIADFRKFSRSFMKLSKIVKGIDDSNNEKLDKGLLPSTLSTAEKIVSALQANGGLKFDPDLLYLNDEGTKKVGYYYLDRLKNGIFECLVETTTTVNDSSKFRDISNKASADRLDNLISISYDNIWTIYTIGNLLISFTNMGILGTNNSQPTIIIPPTKMKVKTISMISIHEGVYATYKTYLKGNKIFAYFIGNSTGHSTLVTLIGEK